MKRKFDEHFTFSKTDAKCNTCGKTFTSGGRSNFGLQYHLEKVHQIQLEESKDNEEPPAKKSGQQSINRFLRKVPIEEMISKEAAMFGATYRYLIVSPLIKRDLKVMDMSN